MTITHFVRNSGGRKGILTATVRYNPAHSLGSISTVSTLEQTGITMLKQHAGSDLSCEERAEHVFFSSKQRQQQGESFVS